jgi:hypothetical protein
MLAGWKTLYTQNSSLAVAVDLSDEEGMDGR